MKQFLHFAISTAFVLSATICAQATTRTVSNNTNIPAQYTSLQTAIDDSATGDTLLIHGSPNTYGDLTILKSLVLIGPGFKPTGQNQLLATMGSVNVRADAAGDVENLLLLGLNIGTLLPHSGSGCGQGFAVKMRLERCILNSLSPRIVAQGPNSSIVSAEQCIFTSTINGQSTFCGGQGVASVLVTNSLFLSNFAYSDNVSNGVVSNCIFFGGSSRLQTVQNTIFSNNVFYGTLLNDANGAKTGCTFNSNLTFGTNNNALTYPASITSGTVENLDPLFANATAPANGQNYASLFNGAQDLNPQPASPLLSAGSDGTDIGPTGGSAAFNYLLQGTAKGPFMTSLIINNATLPENGTLQVTFGAKAQE